MSRKQTLTAIIYDKKGRVISIGKNSYTKTHTYQAKMAAKVGKPDAIFLHAEIHAILRCKNLEDAHRIFISRYDAQGIPKLAKPCSICEEAIIQSGIRHVEYTVDH